MNASPSHQSLDYEKCPCSDCLYRLACVSDIACESYRLFVTYGRPGDRAIGDFPNAAIHKEIFNGPDDDAQILANIKHRRSQRKALTID